MQSAHGVGRGLSSIKLLGMGLLAAAMVLGGCGDAPAQPDAGEAVATDAAAAPGKAGPSNKGSSARTSDFTAAQAASGKTVYQAQCSSCHGADLKGISGPALAGPKFKSSLEFSQWTGPKLYNFIAEHMPADAPGSLTDKQYLRVFAYLLERNGYPAGDKALTRDRLKDVKLLPYPGVSSN